MTGSRLLPLLSAALLSACGALGVLLATSLLYASVPAARGNLPAAAATEAAVYVALAVWLARAARAPRLYAWLSGERSTLVFALIGAALGIALHGPAELIEALVEGWFPLPEHEALERIQRLTASDTLGRILNFSAVAVLVPLAEEVFFRGALWAALRGSAGIGAALSATTVLFTVSHLEPRSWPALFLVAAALGALRLISNSLLPAVLLHATFNATTLLVIFSSPPSIASRAPSITLFLAGSAVSGALFSLAVRLGRPLNGVES